MTSKQTTTLMNKAISPDLTATFANLKLEKE